MDQVQHLAAARLLITNEANWCKGERARNSEGTPVPVMSVTATKFCVKGAMLRVAGSEDADISGIEKFLVAKDNKANPLGLNYVGFNELKKHDQVLAMVDEAILLAIKANPIDCK